MPILKIHLHNKQPKIQIKLYGQFNLYINRINNSYSAHRVLYALIFYS